MIDEIKIDKVEKIDIYTDGGCEPNPGNGRYAVLVVRKENVISTFRSNVFSNTTNNRMEMMGLIESIKLILEKEIQCYCTIFSDSDLTVKTYNEWMEKWEKKDWKRKKQQEVKNLDLVKELFILKNQIKEKNVKVKWIKGHSTNKFNNQVDLLTKI